MAMKWQKKLEDKDLSPDNAPPADDTFQKKLDEFRHPENDRSGQKEYDIELKMTAGKKLSGEEMLYLKDHNRSLYQVAKKIDQERIVYEDALAACTTKEEVEQLKADYAAAAVERINAIRNDPSMSRQKKQELFSIEYFRAAALDDTMHLFIDSSDYENLPDGKVLQQDETDETENEVQETDAKKLIPAYEAADDAGEEGSIVKAILDEQARWAREEEEEHPQSDQPLEGLSLARAKAAYLIYQSYTDSAEISKIDIWS